MIVIKYKEIEDDRHDTIEMFDTVTEFKNYIDTVLAGIEIDTNTLLFNDRPYRDVFRSINFYDKLDVYFQYNSDVKIEVI